jgi:hypothetical protein
VIAELVNDSDSDEYEIEENQIIEDPVSNSSEEGETISEPPTGQKRKRRASRQAADSDLGWKENTAAVNRPAFCGLPELNPNLDISEDSSPLDFFRLFFDNEILAVIQKEINRYAEQQINKKKEEGPLKPKTVHGQWKEVSVQEIKLFFAKK